nr:hypothetical protein [uncultured Carboxylicivirga sp.]
MSIAIVSFTSVIMNIFLGKWRAGFKKMTVPWWLLIHASIPVLIPLRMWLNTPKIWIPFFIFLAIVGQFIGSRYLVTSSDKKQNK